MKATVFDGKNITYLEDFPEPKPSEALVRINLAGICGTDLEILDGYMSYHGILGHEFVGTVEKSTNKDLIGKRVVGEINVGCGKCSSCKTGMERHCPNRTVLGILNRNGAFAEYLSLPEKNLHVIPDSVTDEQAVFVEPLAAAFEITEQIDLKPDWHVAIVGDGRLAHLIASVLKLYCSDITCFGRHENKLSSLKKLGLQTKIGIKDDDHNVFDLVVEATGNNSGFIDTMKLVKPRGTVILKSTIASKENLDLTPTVVNEITLVGSRCGKFRPAIDALASHKISVDDLIDTTYPLEKFEEAIEYAKKPNTLKVFLKP
ncbi:alcohol dehydrogenase catalytic domain-containing protein [Nitrosopumilus sp. K4]|uniref:MDR/zinc-dependent alcohol dehydrogenase-like family protein n=1 Tax=Nitrosopumilus sp. K4 TaxID=2795383 RepID=UPI001BA4A77F|nr:alcohol dehydrogenase catalytic domain-containing protein [Nitrosopumilus sp. K4]QUC64895.1 alcohol dehydrogenase catalytic domain-containing protein [Nitrosopumilus sp. K4]